MHSTSTPGSQTFGAVDVAPLVVGTDADDDDSAAVDSSPVDDPESVADPAASSPHAAAPSTNIIQKREDMPATLPRSTGQHQPQRGTRPASRLACANARR